jgi:hypothetical protein
VTRTLTKLHAEVARHCGEIADLFKRGEARVTILIRNPGVTDGDIVVTDDQFDSAIAALHQLKTKEQRKLTVTDLLS